MRTIALSICSAALLILSLPALSLTIASNPVNGEQRVAIQNLIQKFQNDHPNIPIKLRASEHESYKENIEYYLQRGSSDVFFWFGGNRLRQFVTKGLVLNIDPLWQQKELSKSFTKAAGTAITHNGKAWGLPLYYYQWGIYYRQSFFNEAKLSPPRTWQELEALASKLLARNIAPFTLASKDKWPVAGWFDYLNLRSNGMDFHIQLLSGNASFLDDRVSAVFNLWQKMLDRGYFIDTHDDNDWKSAIPYLYHKKAAMMLMGNFFLSAVPEALRDDFSFIPFPQINPEIPSYEEAPVDILIISANTKNPEDAIQFLEFMATAKSQENLAQPMNMIPTNINSQVGTDKNIIAGADLLKAAHGVTQFFDRDTNDLFAVPAMSILADFVSGDLSAAEAQKDLELLRLKFLAN